MFCKKRLPGYNCENQTYLSLKQSRFRTDIPSKYANISRSSRLKVFCKKGVLRNFAKLIGKHLCQSLFFNKVAACFPVNFAKFLRTPFLTEHLRWLLLYVVPFMFNYLIESLLALRAEIF